MLQVQMLTHLFQANVGPSDGLNTGSCSKLSSRPCRSNRFEKPGTVCAYAYVRVCLYVWVS